MLRGVGAALVAAVALLLAVPAQASPNARFGIQDDAWLLYGPGTLSLGAPLDGLERAEHANVLGAGLAGTLRAARAQSRLRRAARGVGREPGRRRRDLAAADPDRNVTALVHRRHARSACAARRVRAEPLFGEAGRDAVRRRLRTLRL